MKYLINLFPQQEKDTTEKIVFFAFHYLRYILVMTQFVAICVFFFRFRIDQDIVDYKEKLSQKQSIVAATSGLLDRVREVDAKMGRIQELFDKQDLFLSQSDYIFSMIPSEIFILGLEIDNRSISLQGKSSSIIPIREFHNTLKKDKKFNLIELSNIEKTNIEFIFDLKLADFQQAP